MAQVVTGKAVVWGISTGATGTGIGTVLAQSGDANIEGDIVEVKDSNGEVVGQVHYNPKQTFKMEVIPTGTAIADAVTSATIPLPGAIITVADANDSQVDGYNSGKYVFIKGSKKKSNTGVVTLTFEMMQYVNKDITTTIS